MTDGTRARLLAVFSLGDRRRSLRSIRPLSVPAYVLYCTGLPAYYRFVTSWAVKKIFIYIFIFYSPSTQFPRAEILNYGTEITSGMVTRWNKNVVSRGSVVTSVKRLLICVRKSRVLTLMGPSVFSATGKMSWVPLSELYLYLFRTAAVSAALALVMALCCR